MPSEPSGGMDKKQRRGFFAYYPVEALDCLKYVISKARASWYDSFPFPGDELTMDAGVYARYPYFQELSRFQQG